MYNSQFPVRNTVIRQIRPKSARRYARPLVAAVECGCPDGLRLESDGTPMDKLTKENRQPS